MDSFTPPIFIPFGTLYDYLQILSEFCCATQWILLIYPFYIYSSVCVHSFATFVLLFSSYIAFFWILEGWVAPPISLHFVFPKQNISYIITVLTLKRSRKLCHWYNTVFNPQSICKFFQLSWVSFSFFLCLSSILVGFACHAFESPLV